MKNISLIKRREQRHKITLKSGSTFIKYKVDTERGRHRYYTMLNVTTKDRRYLSDKQEALLNPNNIFPITIKDFKGILKTLKTKVEFKTRIK